MRSIAFMSEKGGSGKTTSVLNTAAGLAGQGGRVLVVDVDPQSNASLVLMRGESARRPTVHEVLTGQAGADEAIVSTSWDRVFVLPAAPTLAEVNLSLVNELGRERRLRRALESLETPFDYVLVDTSPQRTLLNVNVLNAVDEVIVPLSPGLFSLAGLAQLQGAIEEVRSYLDNRTLRIGGLLVTMAEKTNVNRDLVEQLRTAFPGLVFTSMIPRSLKIEEAHSRFMPVLSYAPRSPGAIAYRELVEEILTNGQREEDRAGSRRRKSPPTHNAA